MSLRHFIRRKLDERGMTWSDLAKALSVNLDLVNALTTGAFALSDEQVRALARAVGATAKQIKEHTMSENAQPRTKMVDAGDFMKHVETELAKIAAIEDPAARKAASDALAKQVALAKESAFEGTPAGAIKVPMFTDKDQLATQDGPGKLTDGPQGGDTNFANGTAAGMKTEGAGSPSGTQLPPTGQSPGSNFSSGPPVQKNDALSSVLARAQAAIAKAATVGAPAQQPAAPASAPAAQGPSPVAKAGSPFELPSPGERREQGEPFAWPDDMARRPRRKTREEFEEQQSNAAMGIHKRSRIDWGKDPNTVRS